MLSKTKKEKEKKHKFPEFSQFKYFSERKLAKLQNNFIILKNLIKNENISNQTFFHQLFRIWYDRC